MSWEVIEELRTKNCSVLVKLLNAHSGSSVSNSLGMGLRMESEKLLEAVRASK